jgi:hypothetical protein
MFRDLGKVLSVRTVRVLAGATLMLGVLMPRPVVAQPSDEWRGSFAPFYFWATRVNGDLTTRAGSVPVFLTFDDAADKLSAAFSFHFEAQKGRIGLFSDLNFVGLSTDAQFTLQGPPAVVVDGELDFNNTFFEAGASYALGEAANFAIIGGLRTFTMSTEVEFTTPNVSVTAVDASRTAVSAFAGFTYRPAINEKLNFLSRADIGGGSGMSWSALLGFEYRPKPWAGLVIGYKGMGVSGGSDTDDKPIREFDMTYYGPIFGLNLHWGAR